MRTLNLTILPLLAALALAAAPAGAHQTDSGTSSTGDADVYGLASLLPDTDCATAPTAPGCPLAPCTADIYFFVVRLVLIDPSPGDAVALAVVGDLPGLPPLVASLPTTDSMSYPVGVATFDDPVAEVPVQLGGCNRATTAVVAGLVVDGDVKYTITY